MLNFTRDKKHNAEIIRQLNVNDYRDKNALNILNTDFKKYRFVSFDVETTGRNNDFYLCGVIDYNGEYTCYFDKQEVINYFRRLKHNDLIVVATNLSFDYSVIFKDSPYFNDSNFIVNKGRFIMVSFDGTYNKIRFYDTLNYGGLSVEGLGNALNLPKGDKPKCLGKIPKNKQEKQELIDYNKRDCTISRDFMIMMQDTINEIGGELKSTISSVALDIYRRKFMKFPLTRESVSAGLNIKDKIYQAYYGGRTEVFKRGIIKDYLYYDVNNLYGFCMLNEFPVPDSMMYQYDEDRDLLKFEGVSYFEVEVPYMKYPPLPYRKDTKLIFPYGLLKGYWTHLEIRNAQKYGVKILLMKDTCYYTRTEKLFKEYITYMYNRRLIEKKNNNTSKSLIFKLLNNSLYGKFATKSIDKTNFFIATDNEMVKNKIDEAGKGAKFNINMQDVSYYSNTSEYDGVYSMPILSCYVSSYARIHLYEQILKLQPVYVDTDSCITQTKIEDSKELGLMKLEETICEGVIIKPKLYFFNQKVKIKGVRIPKEQKDIDRIKKNILNGLPVHYEKFVKMKEGAKRGLVINSIIVVEKNIGLEDDKRDWKGKLFNQYELQDSEPIEVR